MNKVGLLMSSLKATAGGRYRQALALGPILACTPLLPVEYALAEDVIPPKVTMTTPWGVGMASGAYDLDVTDLSLGGLTLERFTQSPSDYWADYSFFGYNITSNFDIYVEANSVKATGRPYNLPVRYYGWVHDGNSAAGTYLIPYPLGSGTISNLSIDAQAGILSWVGSAYQFINKDGDIYTFNPNVSAHPTTYSYGTTVPQSQKVDHINFADGAIRQFFYDSSQRLKLVTDSSGYSMLFDYGTNGFVSDACAIDRARSYVTTSSTCSGQALTVSYQYGSIGGARLGTVPVLTGFTDALNNTTTYAQAVGLSSNNPSISCVTPPGYSTCKISFFNDANGSREVLADGGVITPGLSPNHSGGMNPLTDPTTASCGLSGSLTDPNGKTIQWTYTKSSPCQITDANGNKTSYQWTGSTIQEPGATQLNDGSLLYSATFPEGNIYQAVHTGPFNAVIQETSKAKPGSSLADRVVTYGYGTLGSSGTTYQNWAKPTSKTDPNGNVTNWTYDTWGGVLSELDPAPTSGAARPLKLYTYVQKYAYILNSSGALVSTGQPIWMPLTETVCQTLAGSSALNCDPGAQQTVTTYIYGADGSVDNLLLRGKSVASGGVTLVTCYSYDQYSHRISETLPNANLATCS